MQTQSRFFDDLARVANGALSAAAGMRAEIEQLVRQHTLDLAAHVERNVHYLD